MLPGVQKKQVMSLPLIAIEQFQSWA